MLNFVLQTLSHAPTWSRDVARLMNAEHAYDWRFLATRLGYSKDDVRSWATQPDPCLSMLDEWFATHKTREATFAVEKALNEMDRTDAAMIVENALKMTGECARDSHTREGLWGQGLVSSFGFLVSLSCSLLCRGRVGGRG